jgi:hypothetical protein
LKRCRSNDGAALRVDRLDRPEDDAQLVAEHSATA